MNKLNQKILEKKSNIESLNDWAELNANNENKDKIFLAKMIYYFCANSAISEEYEQIFEIIMVDGIESFLKLFRGEIEENLYNIYYKEDDIDERLIFSIDITNLFNLNNQQTIN